MSSFSQSTDYNVVLHRHRSRPIDITHLVTFARWTHAVRDPWETIQLSLSTPRPTWISRDRPRLGDWVTILDAPGAGGRRRCLAWGYVSRVSGSIQAAPGGAIQSDGYSVSAISWLSLLGRASVILAPGWISSTIGTLFRKRDIEELYAKLAATASGALPEGGATTARNIGGTLQDVLQLLAVIQLPPSLGETVTPPGKEPRQATIGDQVRVVHDATTRDAYAPNVVADPVPGWSLRGLSAVNASGRSVLQTIQGTFGGDAQIVEMFPSLEDLGRPAASDPTLEERLKPSILKEQEDPYVFGSSLGGEDIVGRGGKSYREVAAERERQRKAEAEQKYARDLRAARERVAPANATAEAMQANPVLVYRMVPWRTEELRSYLDGRGTMPTLVGGSGGKNVRQQWMDTSIFQGETWKALGGAIRRYGSSESIQIEYAYDDSQHVNSVSVGLFSQPDTALRYYERAGLPIIVASDVRRYGLRHYEPDWPFFPPFEAEGGSPLMNSMHTVAVAAAQYMGAAARFAVGSFHMRLDKTLRAGMFVDVEGPLAVDDSVLKAYVESVTHEVKVVQSGGVTQRSTVQYTRGLIGAPESDRRWQFVPEED